jgi:hypothetical protein
MQPTKMLKLKHKTEWLLELLLEQNSALIVALQQMVETSANNAEIN